VSVKWGGTDGVLVDGQRLNATSLDRPDVDQMPDIYYIILDSYARADELQKLFNFDNSEFIDSLTRKGFFVATESRSNYTSTSASLASSLSMRYLNGDEDVVSLLKENEVGQSLKRIGYQYVHLGSGWEVTKRNKHANVEYIDDPLRLVWNDFSFGLSRGTIVYPVFTIVGLDLQIKFWQKQGKHFNDSMGWLREIPDVPGPTFTFSHNIPPHEPFVFDRDGNFPTDFKRLSDDQLYIDQLFYVNKVVDSVLEEILQRSSSEPIIIVQGDHGPSKAIVTPDNPSDGEVLGRTGILNAYYLPEYCRSGLYSTITPVNTFRVVLNSCLGANFASLKDESYWWDAYKDSNAPPIDFSQLQ